tara:strand:- start:2610 stop:3245 length:636 start_codon:yes stop_codon:yes gene_type:complete
MSTHNDITALYDNIARNQNDNYLTEEMLEDEEVIEDEEMAPEGKLYRIYLGDKAWKVDLPSNEMFFDTREEGNKMIDEINSETDGIKLSYECVKYDYYGVSGKKEEDYIKEQEDRRISKLIISKGYGVFMNDGIDTSKEEKDIQKDINDEYHKAMIELTNENYELKEEIKELKEKIEELELENDCEIEIDNDEIEKIKKMEEIEKQLEEEQ